LIAGRQWEKGNAQMNNQVRNHEQAFSQITDRYTPASGGSPWRQVIADRGLQAVVAFSLIGLLLALNLMFRFPDIGAVIEQYNQF
jgi:hypothetical protein